MQVAYVLWSYSWLPSFITSEIIGLSCCKGRQGEKQKLANMIELFLKCFGVTFVYFRSLKYSLKAGRIAV